MNCFKCQAPGAEPIVREVEEHGQRVVGTRCDKCATAHYVSEDKWRPISRRDGDYDMSIHSNPDSRAWAEFFVKTITDLATQKMMATVGSNKEEQAGSFAIDTDYMHGWFANAMMAMRDHLAPRLIKSIDPDSKEAREAAAKGDAGQEGGNHYARLGVTPWDLIKAMEPSGISFVDYARGDIIAYVARLKGEPGKDRLAKLREDLLKAAHCAKEAAAVLEREIALFEKDEEDRATYQKWVAEEPEAPAKADLSIGEVAEQLNAGLNPVSPCGCDLFDICPLCQDELVPAPSSPTVIDTFKDLTEKSIANLMKPSPLYRLVMEEQARRERPVQGDF